MIRFSIIIPTLGRPSLEALLISIETQPLGAGQVIVMGESPDGNLVRRVNYFGPRFRCYFCPSGRPGGYGNPQRNFALPLCHGDYINYQDDDDVMTPGILAVMRANCEAQPGKIFIYQMRWPDGHLNPGYPPRDLAGGQCFVWPNIPGRMGKFGHRYAGDQDFMEQTIALHPDGKAGVIYRPEVITEYAGCHEKK